MVANAVLKGGAEVTRAFAVIFVLGGPGAGKGTQCQKIEKAFPHFCHLSAGDLLREERLRPGSHYGDLIKQYLADGLIVPSQITVGLLKNAMKESNKSHFLIDGFPRGLDNAEMFEEQVGTCDTVLFFDCKEEILENRLLKRGETSGRTDDNIDSIRKRFATFSKQTIPVVEHYKALNKLIQVDAARDVDTVYSEVESIFRKRYPGA